MGGDDAGLWYNYAAVLKKVNRNDEAVKALEKSAELDPENLKAWDNLGRLLLSMEKFGLVMIKIQLLKLLLFLEIKLLL